MPDCVGHKAGGEPCKAGALPGSIYCWAHDPDRAAVRRHNASKGGRAGGKSRPAPKNEIEYVKNKLDTLLQRVRDDQIAAPAAWAVNGLLNTYIRALEIERKIHMNDEVTARIAELEQTLQERGRRLA